MKSKTQKSNNLAEPVFAPGPTDRTVRDANGAVLKVPQGWELLPPGDAGLTRRVKAAGPYWLVQERRGRKVFSRGIWAATATIQAERNRLEDERAKPEYSQRLASAAVRREKSEADYAQQFQQAILQFLAFDKRFNLLAARIAEIVAAHATPVGSGTVARTKRLSIEEKARAAVLAWMRHATTEYDQMEIARVRGRRREVRSQLAKQSLAILERYRKGLPPAESCPLQAAVA